MRDTLNYDLTEIPVARCSDEEINDVICKFDQIVFDSVEKTNSGTILDHLSHNGNYELLGTLQKQCVSKIKERLIDEILWQSYQKDWDVAFKYNVVFDPTQLECLVNFLMEGDSLYQTQIVPMKNSNRSSVETCYVILKHCFPSTQYYLQDKAFIPNEVMSNDKIKETINTSIRRTHFQNTFGISITYYLKNKDKTTKNVFLEIKTYIAYILEK